MPAPIIPGPSHPEKTHAVLPWGGHATLVFEGEEIVLSCRSALGNDFTCRYNRLELIRHLMHPEKHIQTNMPTTPPANREFLISGITPAEWDAMFADEESESEPFDTSAD